MKTSGTARIEPHAHVSKVVNYRAATNSVRMFGCLPSLSKFVKVSLPLQENDMTITWVYYVF